MKNIFFGLLVVCCSYTCVGQVADSTKLELKQAETLLDGDWKEVDGRYAFGYSERVGMGNQMGGMRSDALCFSVIVQDGNVYLKWVYPTSGPSLQRIKSIDKKRLVLVNSDGTEVKYKRVK